MPRVMPGLVGNLPAEECKQIAIHGRERLNCQSAPCAIKNEERSSSMLPFGSPEELILHCILEKRAVVDRSFQSTAVGF